MRHWPHSTSFRARVARTRNLEIPGSLAAREHPGMTICPAESKHDPPGEQFYPQGVHWDDPIARGTLPDLLSTAAADYGARPAIEFRDRAISYAELEGMVEVAASASCAPVTAGTIRWHCSSAIRRIIR